VKKSLTLVIAVYNAVKYLEFILTALERQSFTDFEVVVADDGSGRELRGVVERMRSAASFAMTHVWHEDDGFRKNVILNRAIEAAATDYLVFIDGDCLPHRKFLEDHWTRRKGNALLCGRRVNFSRQITGQLTLEEIRSGAYEQWTFALLWDGLRARSSNLEDALRFDNEAIRRLIPRKHPRILGCNFSVERRLLEAVNGFNEDYRAPGIGEDTDLAFRMELSGAKLLSLRYLATLYHLYHPATHVGDANRAIFDGVVSRREAVCRHGIKNLDHAPSFSVK
jgi:glycosyltransferase involved in cell wall biosynthesis